MTIIIMSLIFVNLIFLPSITAGVGEAFNQLSIDYSYANLVIGPKKDNLYINDADGIQKKLNRLPGVIGASSRYTTGATFTHKSKFVSGTLYSINPQDEEEVTKIHATIIDGEYLSDADTNEILLGSPLAGEEGEEIIGIDPRPNLGGVRIGDNIDVTFSKGVVKKYRVKGIFKTGFNLVDTSAFITQKEMESVLKLDNKASQILIKIDKRGSEEEFKKEFMELGISEDIKTWEEKTAGFVKDIVSSFNLINLILTAVSLIIAVIVIFIVIYINIINKRKQIGILKAIGIDERVIINSYIMQALFYCFSGIIAGMFLLYLLTSYLTANPIKFPMGYVRPLVSNQLIIMSAVSLIIVSLIAGFIPSWRTARMNILKAIWG